MNLSRPFIERPVATVLLTVWVALAGVAAFLSLPVSRLPNVDLPIISVTVEMPGASPNDMSRAVITPLERRLGKIAGVTTITSSSNVGRGVVTLQFELERNIDDAAREVQAAINASRADLPATLRRNPTYRKRNPAAQPFIILALTSETRSTGQIYDEVSSVLSQRLLQVEGVGDVELGGSSLPAVRVELNPFALNRLGVSSEDVRAAIQANNANRPKGVIDVGEGEEGRALSVLTTTLGLHAADYRSMVVASRGGQQVRLSDVADVQDGLENNRRRGVFNGRPAIIVTITQEPGANLIATADEIQALLPMLRAQLPSDIALDVAIDRTGSIRASVHEVQITLVIAVVLVVLVVGLFLRSLRAAVIPAAATVVSLLGTFGVMYLLGYSVNNLTLMALTVATGFVVDDAIVVLENCARHLEAGMSRHAAALAGARQVGFTVLTISVSLVAVFIPLLFMGGQVGRMFREFAMTLSAAVMISLVVSLTTTPMMCAYLLRREAPSVRSERSGLAALPGRVADGLRGLTWRAYGRALDWSLSVPWVVLALLGVLVALTVYLFIAIPKGFFPDQDNGQMIAGLRADQSISSTAMFDKLDQAIDIIRADPAVATVVGFSGGWASGGGFLSASLVPLGQRTEHTRQVIDRLRPKLNRIAGLRIFLSPAQDLRFGSRSTNSTYQYTLRGDSHADLRTYTMRLSERMKTDRRLTDVDDDMTENSVETFIQIDRERAAQLGVEMRAVDAALYNAYGQRVAATMYSDLNQYAIVMEWSERYARSPVALDDLYVPAARVQAALMGPGTPMLGGLPATLNTPSAAAAGGVSTQAGTLAAGAATTTSGAPSAGTAATSTSAGASTVAAVSANPALRGASTGQAVVTSPSTMVPLSAFATVSERAVPTSVWHESGELASTLSFNLAEGVSINEGRQAVLDAVAAIGLPNNLRGSFSGAAALAQANESQQALLIAAAIVVIYLVLGILYESLIHPVTVLSTLPSAGFGAVFALLVMKTEFSVMALIGVLLLIGIVKKNAILIIDFALEAERERGLNAVQAVREACLIRLRPILMTSLAAGLGAVPLAIGFGQGAELRQPLGITIVGGLLACQFITLISTPAVYVLLDRLRPSSARGARPELVSGRLAEQA